jgi:two-component system, OmpR family, sensor kinase
VSIKGRIRALQVVVALAVIAVAAMAVAVLQSSVHYVNRTQWSRQQLAAIGQLAIHANRYSEQIAELLLIGEPERPDLDSARAEVMQAFAELRETTLAESAFVRDSREQEDELIEFERFDRMRTLFGEIDNAAERVFLVSRQGRRDDAIVLFRSEIENRLDAEFAQLIEDSLADERDEVRRIEAGLLELTTLLVVATLVGASVVLGIVIVSGFVFARSIERPIKALSEGAKAIELGDFDYRIVPRGTDEHAVLSHRFNAMAEQLGRQRAMLVGAQEELERQVAERTEQLAEANRQLVATDEQRVRLLTDISHELRTPVTALRGEAEVALRGGSKPESAYRDALAKVVARAADLVRLVEDLLFLARSEAEEMRFDFQRLDLVDLIGQATEEADVLGRERQIRTKLVHGAEPITVRADGRRLRQAVLIVLDNAVKYGNPGACVEVRLKRERDTAEISIRDHGPGIPADEAARVFERFYRGAGAREQWDGGTGLGLPIARWIVEKHGGTVELSSTVGEGTEVLLRLRLAS